MLVIMSQEQLQKFPKSVYDYTDPEKPVLVSSPTFTFKLLAQNMGDYRVCGTIEGNTSGSGDQRNGGMVMIKERQYTTGGSIVGFGRPNFAPSDLDFPPIPPKVAKVKEKK